jgi:hypothetical protein
MAAVKRSRFLGTIARWTLVVLLFAQGALVAEACLRTDASARAAFPMAEMEGCDMGKTNPNACLLGYLDVADQTTAQPTVPPATSYVLVVSNPPAGRLLAFDARAALPPPGNAPPIPIRYCRLLI